MESTAKTTPPRTMEYSATKPSISKLAAAMTAASKKEDSSGLPKAEVNDLVKDWRAAEPKSGVAEIEKLPIGEKPKPRTTFIDGTSTSSAKEINRSNTPATKAAKARSDATENAHKTVQKKPARSIYALASKEPDIEVIDEETLMAEMEERGDEAIKSSVSKVVEEPTRSIYALAPNVTHLGRKTVRRVANEPDIEETEDKPKKRASLFSAFRNKTVRYIPPDEGEISGEVEELTSDELLREVDQGGEKSTEIVEATESVDSKMDVDTELVGYVASARDLINASADNLRDSEPEAVEEKPTVQSDEDAIAKAFEESEARVRTKMPDSESSEVVVPLVREEVRPTPIRPDKMASATAAAERKLQIAKANALKQRATMQKNVTRSAINQASQVRKTPIQATPIVKTSLRLKPASPRNVNIVEKKNDIARIIQMEQKVEDDTPQTSRLQVTARHRVRPARNIDIMQPTRKRPRRAKVPVEVQVMPRPQATPKIMAPVKHTKGPVTIAISVPGEEEKMHHVAVSPRQPVHERKDFSIPVVKRAVPPNVEKFMIDQPNPGSIKVNHAREALARKPVDDLEFGVIEDYYSGDENDAITANRMVKLSKNPHDPVQMVSSLAGNPEQGRFPLGAKSPFLKAVNVEKRPLSEPMEHHFMSDPEPIQPPKVETRQPEKKPFNARDYFLKPEDQKPAVGAKKLTDKANLKEDQRIDKKAAKTAKKEEERLAKESKKSSKKEEKVAKKSRKERKQEKAMMAPTVIIPTHDRSNAPLVLLAVVTIILGAAVGAAVYMCLVLDA